MDCLQNDYCVITSGVLGKQNAKQWIFAEKNISVSYLWIWVAECLTYWEEFLYLAHISDKTSDHIDYTISSNVRYRGGHISQAMGKMRNCGMLNAEGKMRNGMCGATVIGCDVTSRDFIYSAFHQVTGQLADTPTRGLPTRGLDDSRTGHLAYWRSRGLDNSRMPSATLRA